ncbi:MAG: cupin [Parcubacteria group bacterium]|nr:MAG: cupin [Parcubacteria group bacterium]
MDDTKTNNIKHIGKPWGYEDILETNEKYTVKRLLMKQGHQCSYQYHERKMETVLALSGRLIILLDDGEIFLEPGEVITIKPGQKHRMIAREADALYLECSTSELDDVVRISDDYGRK